MARTALHLSYTGPTLEVQPVKVAFSGASGVVNSRRVSDFRDLSHGSDSRVHVAAGRGVLSHMRLALALAACLFASACRPSYAEVRQKYAAEYARAGEAMRQAWKVVDSAEPSALDGECAKQGLTHAVWGFDEKDQHTGNTEVVSHLELTLWYDKPRWDREVKTIKLGPNVFTQSAFASVGNSARQAPSEPGKSVYKGLVPMIEASRSVTHLLVVKGYGTPRYDTYLYDIEKGAIVCAFAVEGVADENVEDKDMISTDSRGNTTRYTTDDVARSRLDDTPRALSRALQERFGFGLWYERARAPGDRPPPPQELLEAKARLKAMYDQRENAAPACEGAPAGAAKITMRTLWWGAGAKAPKELGPFQYVTERDDDVVRMTNPYNPPQSWREGAVAFLKKKKVVVYEPVALAAPKQEGNGSWSPGRLKVRGLVFDDGALSCKSEWELETPPDLRATLSHGKVTEKSARDAATKHFVERLELMRMPN